ncbi:MAG TPA: SDR family oxidoreductase [Candidatus Kapabacteria bacterium]|nr:SDR family oxidoreductase [Candidatus Kapabacteria bacterium]
MLRRHEEKLAVITGAAIGNGRAMASRLAAEGAQVVIADISEATETLSEISDQKNVLTPLYVETDITDPFSVSKLSETIKARFGRFDILVNNAGVYDEEPFELLTFEKWKSVIDVNLNGLFLMSKAALSSMKEHHFGRIINLSSNTVWLGTPFLTHYISSKMGIIGFTRALAAEVGRFGVTVNAITVGLTATQRPADSKFGSSTMLEHVLPEQAIARMETPQDIASVVSFLASDDSAIITGQTINVDGGAARH